MIHWLYPSSHVGCRIDVEFLSNDKMTCDRKEVTCPACLEQLNKDKHFCGACRGIQGVQHMCDPVINKIKFSKLSDDVACTKSVMHFNYPAACLRVDGHDGSCEALACDAEKLDGVCLYCRVPLGAPHHPKCSPHNQ